VPSEGAARHLLRSYLEAAALAEAEEPQPHAACVLLLFCMMRSRARCCCFGTKDETRKGVG
jgi:hypothetical protein